MYNVHVQLSQIDKKQRDTGLMLRLIEAQTEGLAGIDLVLLQFFPRIPGIYAFRPKYKVPTKETWKDLGAVIHDKHGDCKDLVAWRLAELWKQGVMAKAEAILERQSNRLQFHVFIRFPNGTVEDPARELGMP